MSKNIIMLLIIFLIGLGLYTSYLVKNTKELKYKVELLSNNNYAYEQDLLSIKDSLEINKGIYKLSIEDIENSKNTIVKELNSARKELKIKDKELKEMTNFVASIKTDTTINITNILNDSCEFDLRIEYNPQTIFTIKNKKINGIDSLTHSSDISGNFKCFIYNKSSWKEPKFLKRLFLFRWGKNHTERSTLKSDNDKIKIKDFKIIKIEE